MRRLRLAQEASDALDHQLSYLEQQGAYQAASSLHARVRNFLVDFLSVYPATGRYLPRYKVWECAIPRTRLVVWYTFDKTEIWIVTFWHASQDRRQN